MRIASAEIAVPFVVETLAREGTVWVRESTDSMGPLVRAGDRLRLAPAERARIVPGTIVAYRRGAHLIVHRVLACRASGLVTKGDALDRRDEPVGWDALVARVVTLAVPRGRLTDLTAVPWPTLGRLLAALSRLADAVAPVGLASPCGRVAWITTRLAFHVVARFTR